MADENSKKATNHSGTSSQSKSSSAEELEFQIAADLTLYANPLRCLTAGKKSSADTAQEKPAHAHKEKTHKEGGEEIIAADLTKYGSPLDDK
ncbi:hypothetical protein ElyMa_006912100 [Elysia marginata]|uniref:Uncharacterized protein n=1 Tax=Elysia marginata TaxID=1093978 RepID=A0AAV4JGP5_9GAST|nr:hypothetical protein ElyMa_006912100 [Elysia marginata]